MASNPKVNRNSPCPCGSKKKYKKCHLMEDYCDQVIRASPLLNLSFIKPVNSFSSKMFSIGKKCFSFKNKLTKHEFLIEYLRQILGDTWLSQELRKTPQKQHFLAHCFKEFEIWLKRNKPQNTYFTQNVVLEALNNGFVMELTLLARDIAALDYSDNIDKELIKRIKHKREYQGARYEITVATICKILNLEIKKVNQSKEKGVQIVEFTATDKSTNTCLHIEAKSRHQPGTINTPKTSQQNEVKNEFKGLIKGIISKKKPGEILLGFIDLNIPDSTLHESKPQQFDTTVMDSVKKAMSGSDVTRNDHANALIFTNYSFHYFAQHTTKGGLFEIFSPEVTNSNLVESEIKIPHFYQMLFQALRHYPTIPKPGTSYTVLSANQYS